MPARLKTKCIASDLPFFSSRAGIRMKTMTPAGQAKVGNDNNGKGKVSGPPAVEFSMNVGLQFGLTDITSDKALKFQGSLAF